MKEATEQRKIASEASNQDTVVLLGKLPVLELRRQLKVKGVDDTGILEKEDLVDLLMNSNKTEAKSGSKEAESKEAESKEEESKEEEEKSEEALPTGNTTEVQAPPTLLAID